MVIGDFNFVECTSNKTTSYNRLISKIERRLWNELKQTLDIGEIFNRDNGLKYSWDNEREEGQRIIVRLDKVYVINNRLGGFSRAIKSYKI